MKTLLVISILSLVIQPVFADEGIINPSQSEAIGVSASHTVAYEWNCQQASGGLEMELSWQCIDMGKTLVESTYGGCQRTKDGDYYEEWTAFAYGTCR